MDDSDPHQLLHLESGYFRSCWIVFIHVVRGHPTGVLQFSKGEDLGICFIWHSCNVAEQGETPCLEWTRVERCSCLVVHLTSSFRTWWYHLISISFHRHHWARLSVLCASLLVTTQHVTENDVVQSHRCVVLTLQSRWQSMAEPKVASAERWRICSGRPSISYTGAHLNRWVLRH